MAGYVNKVMLLGNLGAEPEVRLFDNGGRVVIFSLATSESWNDRASGERKERTEWHKVAIFNEKLGEVAERYLRKGSKVMVEGALRTRKWQDQSGADRYTTEIVLAQYRGDLVLLGDLAGGDRESALHRTSNPAPRREPAMAGAGGGWAPEGGDLDDRIPF